MKCRMTRRQRWLEAGIILVAAILLAAYLILCAQTTVTWANFAKIKQGMTAREALLILGPVTDTVSAESVPGSAEGKADRIWRWFGEDSLIEIGMDGQERVE